MTLIGKFFIKSFPCPWSNTIFKISHTLILGHNTRNISPQELLYQHGNNTVGKFPQIQIDADQHGHRHVLA